MVTEKIKLLGKLGLGVIAACALCCTPLIAPLILGAGGIGFLVEGSIWYIIAALVILVMYLVYRQTRKGCGCLNVSKCERCEVN